MAKQQKIDISYNSIVFYLVLFFLTITVIVANYSRSVPFSFVAPFIANLALCLFLMALDQKTHFTLYKMTLYFIFVFFILTPYIQLVKDYHPWGFTFTKNTILLSNLCVFVFLLCVLVIKLIYHPKFKKNIKINRIIIPNWVLVSLFLIDVLAIGIFIKYTNVFTRYAFTFRLGTSFDIAIDLFCKSFPILIIAIYTIQNKSYHKSIFFYIVLLFALLVNNPVSNSRFLSFAAYFGILYILWPKLFERTRLVEIIVLLAFCIVFPLASQFKKGNTISLSSFDIFEGICNVDFDAFTMLGKTIEYTQANGLLLGKQIISSIFFFVPRDILPIKGVNSGAIVTLFFDPNSYDNVSCPLIAEGIIDFGIFGLVGYSLLFVLVSVVIDSRFVTSQSLLSKYYYCLFGYWVYILRGSLAPTILRLFGFLLPFLVCYLFLFLFRGRNNRDSKYLDSSFVTF